MIVILAFVISCLGIILLWGASRRQAAAGLPGGRVIYSDTSRWQAFEESLHDPLLDLVGKPDYLVEKGGVVIPVEVKTGRTPDAPYDSHIFQLAAYCILVEREYKHRPPYGILHYPNRTYAVDFTESLESALLDVLSEIRDMERKRNVDRSHDEAARCGGCGYRSTCEQRI
jgi:CRISPR-associated exonuclease Cas4